MEQLPFLAMLPQVPDWQLPRLSDLPQSWADARRVCIDFETKDRDLKTMGPGMFRPDNYVCGMAIAIEDGPAHYLPLCHEGGDNIVEGPAAAWQYLKDRLTEFRGTLVAANASYEMGWGLVNGVDMTRHKWKDPLVAEPLIWELHRNYKLDTVLKRWDLPGKDEDLLKLAASFYKLDCKRDLWKLPGRFVRDYGVGDVKLPLQLLRKLEKRIDDEDLTEVWDLESRVTPILARMRHRGIRVNLDKVDNVERWARKREADLHAQIYDLTGRRVSPDDTWDKDSVAALFESQGVKVNYSEAKPGKYNPKTGKTTGGKKSEPIIDSKYLEGLKHPLGKLVRRWREVNKLYTTFCARTKRYAVKHGDEWRVHCTFNQLRASDDQDRESVGADGQQKRGGKGTRTGRLSSDNYNYQQEPSRSSELVDREDFPYLDWERVEKWTMAQAWRDIYEPDRGKLWGSLDYSQQEPRIECHFAELAKLRGAKEAGDRWRANPRLDGHQLVVDLIYDLTGIKMERKIVKNLRLGLGYGMGGAKLCEMYLHTPTEYKTFDRGKLAGKTIKVAGPEGQKIIDAFRAGAPFIYDLNKMAEQYATARGWVRTLKGRVIHFEIVEMYGEMKAKDGHAASNGICQGGAASQMKQAMVDLEAAGHELQGQIHDEAVLSLVDEAQGRECQQIMQDAIKLTVPVIVDLEIGCSMGQAA